jgi:DNA-binding CsgD family transcriptional regulator
VHTARAALPLLERGDELDTLRAGLAAARAGRGGVVVLEGAAGAGKSALIAATCAESERDGLRVIAARGGELEQDYPFGVIRQLYEPVLASVNPKRRARLLAGAAAPAAWVLGMSEGETGIHAAGFVSMHAIYWLTAQLAAEQALVLTVDDAHWADASSLRALDFLARRMSDLPAVLIVALRPEEPGARMDLLDELRHVAERRVSLKALRPASVARIVRDQIPDASNEICDACHAATAGNPLYVRELLRTLSAGDVRPDRDAVSTASVPTLGDRVIRRVDRVADDAPALARAMAVLGDGARLTTAAALATVTEEQAGRIAHRLLRVEILRAEDPIAFVHPLVRRSIYDSIPEAERQTAHRHAARLLEASGAPPEAVGAHLRTLTPSGDASVASTLLAAAERALDRAALDEAADWLERALAEDAVEPPRIHLLARLAAVKTIQRDPSAITELRQAYELAEHPEARSRMAFALAEVLGHAGQWDAAVTVIESIESELDDDPDTELQAEVAAIRAVVMLNDPARIDEFDRRRARYVELARGDYWASHALAALLAVEAAHRGRPQEALAFNQRALESGRLLGQRGAGAWAAPQVLYVFIEAEQFDQALAAIDQVDAAAHASGSVVGLLTVAAFRGAAYARRGDLAGAEADLATALGLAREAGLLMGITTMLFILIDVLLERDNQSHVGELVEQTQLGPDFLATTSGAMLLEVRGRLRLARRDRRGGIDDLRAAGRIISAMRYGPLFSTWRSSLALALPAADRDEANALASEELKLAQLTGLARPRGIALRTLGVLQDAPNNIDLLRQSVALLEGSPARLEHARSLVELGGALRRANQRSDARGPLGEGMRLAHVCGAHRLTQRAKQELQAGGGRRPRLSIHGRDALTASELRVVKLASSGATNTEIAQELYVSLKTIETHLSHSYLKLGLAGSGSRGRLAEVLERATAS